MDLERWSRLSPLLDVLLELEPEAREQQLRTLRAEDPELAAELERLLALEDDGGGFMDQPLLEGLTTDTRIGTLLGPYRLKRLLGEGGMGLVWLADRADGLYQRQVALKLLRPGLADPNLRMRFRREREILARLEHPNIARLLDAGVGDEGQPYLALEYVEGVPITDYCRARRCSVAEILRLFRQVCNAVSHAHANLIVHRDIKPSNILVTDAGDVRLLDFGIAKLLDSEADPAEHPRTEMRAFTLHYAAPEQIRGEPVTTRTDVYSLGVVLYELLVGAKPYRLRRQSDAEWERTILGVDAPRPSVAVLRNVGRGGAGHGGITGTERSSGHDAGPGPAGERSAGGDGGRVADRSGDTQETGRGADAAASADGDCTVDPVAARRRSRELAGDLDNILLKALLKRPEHRYPSVEALAADLQRYTEGRPVQARPQHLGYRLQKYLARHRLAVVLVAASGLLLASAFGLVAWQARQAFNEASRAQALQDFVIGLFDNAGSAQRGEYFDARQLLLAGRARGGQELAGQPRAHAELLGVIARLHIGLGDYREAQALLEQQQVLIDGLKDVPDGLRLDAVTQRGRVLRFLSRPRECVAAMEVSSSLVRRMQLRAPGPAAEFYAQLGRCRRALGERQAASQLLQRSLELRRGLNDQVGVVENLMDLAALDGDTGRVEVAVAGFRRAAAHLRDRVSPRHPLMVDIERSLGALYRDRGDVAAAEAALRRAVALGTEVHGGLHPVTLTARRLLAGVLVDLGRLDEAETHAEELHQATLEALGPEHRETASSWGTLAIVALERGNLRDAVAHQRRAVEIWRGQDGSQLLPHGLYNLGLILHAAGRDAEALRALQESREIRVATLGASHPQVGDTDRLIGEVQLSLGQLPDARASLDRAVRLTRVGYTQDHPRALAAQVSWYQYRALAERSREAVPQLDALGGRRGEGVELARLRWQARAYAAQARCRLGEAERARRDLDQLRAELRRALPAGGSLARQVAELRTACR